MNTTSYPIKPIKTEQITLTTDVEEISTKSQPCLMTVVEGNVYIAGKRDTTVSTSSYLLAEGETLRFFGDIKLCSDEDGADVRILYYDVV